jgi:ribosomal-protein-alanine N-acetyltransferase
MDNSPANLVIRAMTAEDADRVLEIAAESPQAPHWPRAVYLAALEPESTPKRIALVAVANLRVEGFAVVGIISPQAELESIAVAAAARRRGLAGRLLTALMTELKQQKVAELLLEVRASNQPALEFYGGRGFESVGVRARYYSNPEEDAVLMKVPIL